MGSTFSGISDAAEKLGFISTGVRINFKDLSNSDYFPCIAHWKQKHFVVIYKVKNNKVYISDPAHGRLRYNHEEFIQGWANRDQTGLILKLRVTDAFRNIKVNDNGVDERAWSIIKKYVYPHRKFLLQLISALLLGSMLQLTFPFLTQSIVDTGIRNKDIHFIYLILLCQLFLFIGKISLDVLRSFILMHLSSRINIILLSDFFEKLMKLPLRFFDIKMTGDILQRINDHNRIENFLTSVALNVVLSAVVFFVYSILLYFYNVNIFLLFTIPSVIYFLWIRFFMKKQAILDYKKFSQLTENSDKNLELINGIQEIKLHNAEALKKEEWEVLQIKLFRINLKILKISLLQGNGANLINELKNILILFWAANLVVEGQITLGMMLSISYIIGQLNSPILFFADFLKSWQEAKLSIERVNEIHQKTDEEQTEQKFQEYVPVSDLVLSDLSFKYDSSLRANHVLHNINLTIPQKKVLAVVGPSGSGKTTLIKVLLKFYNPTSGSVLIGNKPLNDITNSEWRKKCGVVMQEGYIFNDSIAKNIALGDKEIDIQKLEQAARIANVTEFIDSLPMKYETIIGQNGIGISTGQKQRILIARAVYKSPEVLFFDEATSALDATNEKVIMENLQHFFKGKTVIIIAHRLSTVKNADCIIVMEKGRISEMGTHPELVQKRKTYYNLIRNQLELEG